LNSAPAASAAKVGCRHASAADDLVLRSAGRSILRKAAVHWSAVSCDGVVAALV
jgi:hypothetical protein